MRRAGGFTLLEALMVVAILATIAALVLPMLDDTQEGAFQDAARHELAAFRDACLHFKADARREPASFAELVTLPASLAAWDKDLQRGWRGPYLLSGRKLPSGELADPWGKPYRFDAAGGRVLCIGKNGQDEDGAGDDLVERFR
jgi:type II secretion system protein G